MEEKTLSSKTKLKIILTEEKRIEELCQDIIKYVAEARSNIVRSIDREMVVTYWRIGKGIVEEEYKGNRAGYGDRLLNILAEKLKQQLGKGYGVTNLGYMKQFYSAYPKMFAEISHAVRGKLTVDQRQVMLSWTHYRSLLKVTRKEARNF